MELEHHYQDTYMEGGIEYDLEVHVYVTKEGISGWFEHYATDTDVDGFHTEGSIEFNEDGEVDGYDGCYDLDEKIKDVLGRWGFIINV